MNTITITDPVGLREAVNFAQAAGCVDELGRGLVRLFQTLTVGMTEHSKRTAEIGKDFAPHSFTFCIWDGERLRSNVVLVGGLIYAGPTAPGDGSAPSFSVDLAWAMGERPAHSWSIHT